MKQTYETWLKDLSFYASLGQFIILENEEPMKKVLMYWKNICKSMETEFKNAYDAGLAPHDFDTLYSLFHEVRFNNIGKKVA